RRVELCSARTRSCARFPMVRSCDSFMSFKNETTCLESSATRISSPVCRKVSSPVQKSETRVAPQAAASNKRTDGEKPEATIAWRIKLNVSREDGERCGCQWVDRG